MTQDYVDWFNYSKSFLIGQDYLLQEIILNFIEKRSNISGFHGFLLDGVTGSGKTALGLALKETCPFDVIFKDCIEIFVNSKIGGSEKELEKIISAEKSLKPKLIILDNSECLFSSTQKGSQDTENFGFSLNSISIERKMFLFSRHLIDKINREANRPVFLMAILPDKSVLPAEIRLPGRLNYSFNVNISKSDQRAALLRNFLKTWPFESENSKEECVKILSGQPTSGFTPADLQSFLQKTWEITKNHPFTHDDFLKARHFVSPSSIVALVTKIPESNTNIIGLEQEIYTIQQYLSAIFRNDDRSRSVPLPRGILLEGPSGCGKSLLAAKLSKIPFKIAETDASFPVNFISIDSTQIISKYFGQSDRNLSKIFKEARQAAPCILFFDQIDTLVGKRSSSAGDDGGGGGSSDERLVTTFLVEMDGLKSKLESSSEESKTVIVLGTTSKKNLIDPAILRPGRLDLHVSIPLPNRDRRRDFITKFMSRVEGKYFLSPANILTIVDATEGLSYAELDSIFKEAAMSALREDLNCTGVEFRHFKLKQVK